MTTNSHETSREEITLGQFRESATDRVFGIVQVNGAGVAPGTRIVSGIAKFLSRIPDEGVSEEDVSKGKALHIRWVRDYLVPAGLVERRKGSFYRTDVANKATYSINRPLTGYTLYVK